uniref:Uncharacterized protein n=1 Tax=Lactuca sativa TaxID=4236 RepID=A0A9R1W0N1_LACSA|nr:hypothetical protein LSAT_V11C300106560 [Lactuca sativa]
MQALDRHNTIMVQKFTNGKHTRLQSAHVRIYGTFRPTKKIHGRCTSYIVIDRRFNKATLNTQEKTNNMVIVVFIYGLFPTPALESINS